MSKNEPREHHFVPQFYLRAFSGDKKSIRLFNFSGNRHVIGAPIKSQCAKRQFHAFLPGLEQDLGTIEGESAAAIRSVLGAGEAPVPGTAEWQDVLSFIVLQKMRTARSASTVEKLGEFLASHLPGATDSGGSPDQIEARLFQKNPVAIAMMEVPTVLNTASDLGMHLLINETAEEFITCDDPVVMHNQFCEGIHHRGVLGWGRAGIQIFFPLSPHAILFLFDPVIYKVEGNRHGKRVAALTDVRQVRRLNELQALNAHENIYYHAPLTDSLKAFCERMRVRRVAGRSSFMESEPVEGADGTMSQLLHTFEPLLPVTLDLPQIEIRRRSRRIPLHARSGMYRHRTPAPPHPSQAELVRYPVGRLCQK